MAWTVLSRVQLVVLASAVRLVISLGPQGKQNTTLLGEEVAFSQHARLGPLPEKHNIKGFGK